MRDRLFLLLRLCLCAHVCFLFWFDRGGVLGFAAEGQPDYGGGSAYMRHSVANARIQAHQ